MNQDEHTSLLYLLDLLACDDTGYVWSYSLQEVMSEINRAPLAVKQFLERRCPTMNHLEDYLNNNAEYFWVENGRVTRIYPTVVDGSDKAERYFEDILDTYIIPPNYRKFYGHIGQADPDAQDFIQLFYPGDFKQFLLNNPDIFVVYDNGTVSLIKKEAVNYFQKRLKEGREGWYYMNLRGCIGQAPNHIIDFINDYYPEENFLQFLVNNSSVFDIDEENSVFLN